MARAASWRISLAAEAEQVSVGQGGGGVGLHPVEGITEGLVGAGQTQQHVIPLDGDGTEFHHAANDEPDVVLQQRHITAGTDVNKAALLIVGFKKLPESFLAAGFTGGREYHGKKRVGIRAVYAVTPATQAKIW